VYYLQGNCTSAIPELRLAVQGHAAMPRAEALLALCSRRVSAPDGVQLLERSFHTIKDEKLQVELGLDLADLLCNTGKLEEAAPVLTELLQLQPDNVDALFLAQRTYSELANNALTKLALLAPGSPRMEQAIAEHLIITGDGEKAVEHYRKALALDSRLAGAHFELGEALLEISPLQPSRAAAKQQFVIALQNDGDTAAAESRLADLALDSDPSEALQRYKRAYELDPSNNDAAFGVARVLIAQKKWSEALPYLQAIVGRNPMRSDARYQLFLVLRDLGRREEAKEQLQLFLSAKEAQKQVSTLFQEMNLHGPENDTTEKPKP
jgi:tetratricopeptide (TPR) repeat protein